MNTQLSRREKGLLYFLLCFLLVVGGFYLVFTPLSKYYDALETKYGDVQMQQNMQRMTILSAGQTQAQIDGAQETLAQQKQFDPVMTNEELNKILSGLVEGQHAMQITSIQMSDTKQAKLSEYWSQQRILLEQAKAKVEGAEAAKPESLQVYINQVTLTLSGSNEALIGLIDDINTRPAMRVTNVTLGSAAAQGTYSLMLEVYMI